MDPQGTFEYAGIHADGAFSVSRSGSIVADRLTAQFVLGVNLPRYGDIRIAYGSRTIVMRDCRAALQTIPQSNNGRMKNVTFEDRRWRWRFPRVYGEYNAYVKGMKSKSTKNIKSARQLVQLCLEAMNERNVDVSKIPNDAFPTTHFDGNVAADELEKLVAQFGCRVVLGWDDAVRIVEIAKGNRPPNDARVMDYVESFEPPIIPEYLVIEAGRTLFQCDLPLEAVGYEAETNEIKPIDELTYKPANGWEHARAPLFSTVEAKYRKLAESCIWKLYRVRGTETLRIKQPAIAQAAGGVSADTYNFAPDNAYDASRLVLQDKQLSLYNRAASPANTDPKDNLCAAEVIGYFTNDKQSQKNNVNPVPTSISVFDFQRSQGDTMRSTYPERIYAEPFSIDSEQQLIRFSKPVFIVDRTTTAIGTASKKQALLLLRTAFELRDVTTFERLRMSYQFKVRDPNAVRGLRHVLRVEELLYECGVETTTDDAEFIRQCEHYAKKELNKYQLGESATVPAKGFLFDVEIDGSIDCIRLDRDGRGACTTLIEWQTENPVERLTYDQKVKQRQANEQMLQLLYDKQVQSREQSKRPGAQNK